MADPSESTRRHYGAIGHPESYVPVGVQRREEESVSYTSFCDLGVGEPLSPRAKATLERERLQQVAARVAAQQAALEADQPRRGESSQQQALLPEEPARPSNWWSCCTCSCRNSDSTSSSSDDSLIYDYKRGYLRVRHTSDLGRGDGGSRV